MEKQCVNKDTSAGPCFWRVWSWYFPFRRRPFQPKPYS